MFKKVLAGNQVIFLKRQQKVVNLALYGDPT